MQKLTLYIIALLSVMVANATNYSDNLLEALTDTTDTQLPYDSVVHKREPVVVHNTYGGYLGQKSALTDVLQKPQISQFYPNKKLFDRLFLETGVTTSVMLRRSLMGALDNAGYSTSAAFGDWITPEHGVRIGVSTGYNKVNSVKSQYFTLDADYMVNMTALRAYRYRNPKKLQIMGIAGLSLYHTEVDGNIETGWDFHMGLRGQYQIRPYIYLYVEPQMSLANENVMQEKLWHKMRPGMSLSAGIGYNLSNYAKENKGVYLPGDYWLNNTYVTVLGGVSDVANSWSSTWKDYIGARQQISLGKILGPVWGVQMSVWTGANRQQKRYNTKAKYVGFGPEVVANLHNYFGGYKPDRKFYVNAIAGVGFNHGWQYVPGGFRSINSMNLSGALQANIRIADWLDLVIEPRVDLFGKKFFKDAYTMRAGDALPSLNIGLTMRNGNNVRELLNRNADYSQTTKYDDMFAEWAGGLSGITNTDFYTHTAKFVRMRGYIGYGKWLTPTSGVRLWLDMGPTRQTPKFCRRTAGYGVDYVWNITNAFYGYKPDRKFFLMGSLGLTAMKVQYDGDTYFGIKGAVKGLWMINPLWGVFVEPQIRVLDSKCLKNVDWYTNKDYIGSVIMGVHLSMKGYQPGTHKSEFDGEQNQFVSAGIGKTCYINGLRHAHAYGTTLKVLYGKWYSPISAFRVGGELYRCRMDSVNYTKFNVLADYVIDMSTFTFGYNPNRVVNSRFIAGVGLGTVSYEGTTRLVPDIHFGSQLGIKIKPNLEIFGEPHIAYQIDHLWVSVRRLHRASLQGIIGVNYKF